MKKRILIVDDERDLVETLAEILELRGYEIKEAFNATEARNLIKDFEPCVALVDIRLGRGSGVDLIEEIKKEHPRTLCVMMTAYAAVETAVEALQKGAYDYLRKPLNTEDLLATLDRCFEKHRLEEEKKSAEGDHARLAMAVEQSANLVVITKVDGEIIYVNPAFEKLTGYSSAEAIGQTPRILKSGKHGKEFYREMWETLNRGDTWRGQFINKKKNGSLYQEEASISPLRDSSGKIVNFVASKRDITHEVQLEARLRQAQKLESIGTLAGGIAHDFNNLLLPIIGFTELVREDLPEGSEERSNLEKVLKASRRAGDLVRQILTFSRKVDAERQPVMVQMILNETLKLIRATIPQSIDIIQSSKLKSGTVLADPVEIHQIIMNLCTNAYQAMEDDERGTLEIGLDTLRVDSDLASTQPMLEAGREYIRLSVSDTGHGMDKQTQQRIFDPFFTTKPKEKGTGLGLATTHGIVTSLNGAISVYSEPQQGTNFQVYLPRFELKEATAPLTEKDLPRGKGQKILLVDDEPFVLEYGRQILKRIGYEVEGASSGAEALERFRANPKDFDLLLTDQAMPNQTGTQLATEIHKIRPDIPILLTTGFTDSLTAKRLKARGVRSLVLKPFTRRAIAEALAEAFSGKK